MTATSLLNGPEESKTEYHRDAGKHTLIAAIVHSSQVTECSQPPGWERKQWSFHQISRKKYFSGNERELELIMLSKASQHLMNTVCFSHMQNLDFFKGQWSRRGTKKRKETSRKGAQERKIAWMNMIEVQYTYVCACVCMRVVCVCVWAWYNETCCFVWLFFKK